MPCRVSCGRVEAGEGDSLASRSNTRFQKRLKELARAAKRREKEEKRQLRKANRVTDGSGPPIEAIDPTDLGLPPLEDEITTPDSRPTF